jgi:cytokinin riboside 5'-monophosphate phosphoribohydrolase
MEGNSAHQISKICVFCGSQIGKDREFVEAALNLGKVLAERKIHLVYGGGSLGLMGCVSTAAHLGGGQVLGVIPKPLAVENITGKTIGHEIKVQSMHGRMAHMLVNSDAFIALPGGFGTLEEIFGVASWAQLNIHQKPIGLLNVNNFFDPLLRFIDSAVEQKFISHLARRNLLCASTADELIDQLQAFVYEPDPLTSQFEWSEEVNKKRKMDLTLRL